MSRQTIVTCDRCGERSDRAGFTMAYSFGIIPGASRIQRQAMEFDLCEKCFQVVMDAVLLTVRTYSDNIYTK